MEQTTDRSLLVLVLIPYFTPAVYNLDPLARGTFAVSFFLACLAVLDQLTDPLQSCNRV
jgi:hypothetical protein